MSRERERASLSLVASFTARATATLALLPRPGPKTLLAVYFALGVPSECVRACVREKSVPSGLK